MSFWAHEGDELKEPYHYKGCGLDDIYLVSGYETLTTAYGPAMKIRNLESLHDAIGEYLARYKKVLTGKELRFLRHQMDLTQSTLGKYVGLTSQQVARWEKGESEISGAAEFLLRALYLEHTKGRRSPLLSSMIKDLDSKDEDSPSRLLVGEANDGTWEVKAA